MTSTPFSRKPAQQLQHLGQRPAQAVQRRHLHTVARLEGGLQADSARAGSKRPRSPRPQTPARSHPEADAGSPSCWRRRHWPPTRGRIRIVFRFISRWPPVLAWRHHTTAGRSSGYAQKSSPSSRDGRAFIEHQTGGIRFRRQSAPTSRRHDIAAIAAGCVSGDRLPAGSADPCLLAMLLSFLVGHVRSLLLLFSFALVAFPSLISPLPSSTVNPAERRAVSQSSS